MPLPQPILDDRSYQQLRDELVRRIPVYAPEWTDFNASDPGITLIELFSFLGENLLFRFNQIPETTKLQFLRLLDVPLHPAAVANGWVAFTTQLPDGVLVPCGTTVRAGSVPFQTTVEAHTLPVSARAVGRLLRDDPKPGEETAYATRSWDAYRRSDGGGTGEQPVYYSTQVLGVDPTAPGAQALDLAKAVDETLWIAVLAEKGADKQALNKQILNVGFVPDTDVVSMVDVDPCPGTRAPLDRPTVRWQASTGVFDGSTPRYRDLSPVGDTTEGLTRPGVVRFELPNDISTLDVFTPSDPDAVGTGDLPPEIDAKLEAQLLFWLRARRLDSGKLERLLWVEANAASVQQVLQASAEFVGTGNGEAHQTATLVNKPVLPGTLVLEVEESAGWTRWKEVDDFDASHEDDRHFVLDPEAGRVTFGGPQGAAPQIGQRIRALSYLYGGGLAGVVPVKAISKIDLANVKVSNPLPTVGGADGEPIAAALERVPAELRRHDRAVTASDFKELALATPGVTLGRTECLPLFYPRAPDEEAAGVVSVVVWPREDAKHPSAPTPDRPTLDLVCRWLDARRLVTTELYVIPPTYRQVAVAVGIETKQGYGIDAVRRWVELVIRQYLAPLPPYGPTGEGWPLGGPVYGRELEAAALQVEGVRYLIGLDLAWRNDAGDWVTVDRDHPVVLAKYEVPELAEIGVVEGAVPPIGQTPPPPSVVPVPVPVPREEC